MTCNTLFQFALNKIRKKRFCNPIWIIWLKILRKRLYHDLQHLISKQFAGDRAQPHDTISSNSADDRKRQIVDQDHQLALPWVVIICPRLDRGWTVLETIAIPWKPFVSGLTIPAAADLVDIPLKSLTLAYNLRHNLNQWFWLNYD